MKYISLPFTHETIFGGFYLNMAKGSTESFSAYGGSVAGQLKTIAFRRLHYKQACHEEKSARDLER